MSRPVGLHRDHTWDGAPWWPHQDAVNVAIAAERFMDVDDHLDRYLLRCRELGKTPRSGEWLRWLLDDDTASRERTRAASMRSEALTDDSGTPRSWRV